MTVENSVLTSMALGLSTLGLAACGIEAEQVEQAPGGVSGLSVENVKMVLNPVSGNPAAVYFDLSYEGDKTIQVRRVDVAGAESAVLHNYMDYNFEVQMMEMGPFVIRDGETLEFKPGDQHVMAMNVSPELKPGDDTEVTMTIAGGEKFSFPAEVRAAGEDR